MYYLSLAVTEGPKEGVAIGRPPAESGRRQLDQPRTPHQLGNHGTCLGVAMRRASFVGVGEVARLQLFPPFPSPSSFLAARCSHIAYALCRYSTAYRRAPALRLQHGVLQHERACRAGRGLRDPTIRQPLSLRPGATRAADVSSVPFWFSGTGDYLARGSQVSDLAFRFQRLARS